MVSKLGSFINNILDKIDKVVENENTYNFVMGYFLFSLLMYILGSSLSLTIIIVLVCFKNAYNLLTERVKPNYGETWWVILGALISFSVDFLWMFLNDIPLTYL